MLFLITGSIHAESGRIFILGTAGPILKQLGFSPRGGRERPYVTQIAAQWTLSAMVKAANRLVIPYLAARRR